LYTATLRRYLMLKEKLYNHEEHNKSRGISQ